MGTPLASKNNLGRSMVEKVWFVPSAYFTMLLYGSMGETVQELRSSENRWPLMEFLGPAPSRVYVWLKMW